MRRESTLRRLASRILGARKWLVSRVMAPIRLRACDSVGAGTHTYFRPHVENRGRIVIAAKVRLNSNWAPVELVTGPGGAIEIGERVYVNYGTLISAQQRTVKIGADVMVGNYAIIADTEVPGISMDAHPPFTAARDIEIGDRVWIAARVTVLPGARIGAGAIIAAGSIVAGDIPAGVVAAGIPARVIRATSSEEAAAE